MIERILSRLLRGRHAGETNMAWNDPAVASVPASFAFTSASFPAGGAIPLRFAGKGVGENISPALSWSDLPLRTASLALIMEDPDAPMGSPFVHMIATGIDPAMGRLAEAALSGGTLPPGLSLGRNTFRKRAYAGPRPLPGHGPHRYVFQLFAIDQRLEFARPPNRRELMAAIAGHVIARARLDGFVERR